jgi:SAM-dependent methyltransferase
MATTDSYHPARHPAGLPGEIERLAAQARLTWAAEQRRLLALGVADGQRLLDMGCGSGAWTGLVSAWLPHSTVVGVDCDRHLLAQARERLAATAGRVELVRAPVEATGLPDASFDVAVVRYVLQHAGEPGAVAREARRLLRPGGLLVAIDVDDGLWGLAEPAMPAFRAWHALAAAAQGRRGGDRFLGRRLGRLLRQAGFARVGLDVFAVDSDAVGLENADVHLNPDRLLPLVADGRISLADYVRATDLHRQFIASPDAFVLLTSLIAWGHKP